MLFILMPLVHLKICKYSIVHVDSASAIPNPVDSFPLLGNLQCQLNYLQHNVFREEQWYTIYTTGLTTICYLVTSYSCPTRLISCCHMMICQRKVQVMTKGTLRQLAQ